MPLPPILSVLQNELAELEGFATLLEQEQQALINNALNDLVEFAKQKTARAQTLEALARERKRLFDVNSVVLADDTPPLFVSAQHLDQEYWPAVAECWLNILNIARHASALNQTNGKLIETRQQQNQQLMALIQANSQSTMSYDAYGQPRLSKQGGSLGKA